ncbi:MAG: hypothetical protein RL292_6, partial [Candidatus Parcubacteria bacterium]
MVPFFVSSIVGIALSFVHTSFASFLGFLLVGIMFLVYS